MISRRTALSGISVVFVTGENWGKCGLFESHSVVLRFFFLWLYSPIHALAASMKLSVSLQLLDLGQSVGLLERVISLLQGLYLYTNTEKRAHNTH
jgi:hypothetical protein